MKSSYRSGIKAITVIGLAVSLVAAQTNYQPKFPGDPARSDSEAAALGYMRTVLRAQHQYEKKNGTLRLRWQSWCTPVRLPAGWSIPIVATYPVGFRSHKDGFVLTLTPKQLSADHRSFYAEDDGKIHAEETKAADEDSPIVK